MMLCLAASSTLYYSMIDTSVYALRWAKPMQLLFLRWDLAIFGIFNPYSSSTELEVLPQWQPIVIWSGWLGRITGCAMMARLILFPGRADWSPTPLTVGTLVTVNWETRRKKYWTAEVPEPRAAKWKASLTQLQGMSIVVVPWMGREPATSPRSSRLGGVWVLVSVPLLRALRTLAAIMVRPCSASSTISTTLSICWTYMCSILSGALEKGQQ